MVLRSDRIRWLFWIRWLLFTRRLTRGPRKVWNIIALVLVFALCLVAGIGLAALIFLALRFLPSPTNTELMFLLFTGLSIFWLLLPIIGFNTNDGLDLSKLSVFPLSRFELMASLVISTLLDIPTVFLFFLLSSVVAGWSLSLPLALFTLLTMLVFYVLLIGSSQLVLALLSRFLHSRRFRDLAVIIAALLSFSGYLCQFASRGVGSYLFDIFQLQNTPFSPYLQWAPPGMAARAIEQASVGQWSTAFLWLAALCVVSFALLYFWQLVMENALSASESSGSVKRARRAASKSTGSPGAARGAVAKPTTTWHLLPQQSLAILLKDIRYYWREPQIKVRLVRSFISIFFLAFFVTGFSNNGWLAQWRMLYLPFLVFFSLTGFSHNSFGYERQNVATLFLFPVDPKRLLWGKNILFFLLGVLELLLAVPIMAVVTQSWEFALPAFLAGLIGFGVVLGFGNLAAVFFPSPVLFSSRNIRRNPNVNMSAGDGCLFALKNLGLMLIELVVLVPVLAGLMLPVLFHMQWLWIVTIPASFLYSSTLYIVLTQRAASSLLQRTPEILERVTLYE